MPIRMTNDTDDQSNDYNDDKGSGGGGSGPNIPGGGGGLAALLPLLLGLFRSKAGIVLLLIAGAAYFFLGRKGCNMSSVTQNLFSQSGYSYDSNQFNKAKIYEGLDPDPSDAKALPEAISLLKYAPARGDQGQQGSCVAWSSAYAAQTILTAAATGVDPNSIAFSPSYLYNQIRLDGCEGSYVQRAMETMQKNGGVPLSEYPYNDQDCERAPSSSQIQEGRQYAIHGFTRLTEGDNTSQINVRALKEHLAKDAPVVIGMMVGNSFMDMKGKQLWEPSGMDASQMGMGGHAMCVIGYDDRKFGGAFQIMNSWTPEWGDNGIAWVRYGDFKQYVREAYGIDPLPKSANVAAIPLECTIGMIDNSTKQPIQVKSSGNNSFESVSTVKVGTRFKMEVKNSTECYTYIFGMETDGSSYVLFPYTEKYSPYCGITGYRLFPKGQSLTVDSIGHKDYFAIVVSKEELDYKKLNQAISSSSQSTYAGKINEALQDKLIRNVNFSNTADGNIYFKASANDNKVIASIVAFNK